MNLSRACALEVPDGAAVSGVAFHPTKPVVAIAMDRSVSLFDVNGNFLLGRVETSKPVTALTLNATTLVAKAGAGDFHVWEYASLEPLENLFYQHNEERPILGVKLCPVRPLLVFCRLGSKIVFVHDVSRKGIRKPTVRLDCKKPISAVALHPLLPFLAVYSEGTIRIWDLETSTQITQCDDLLRQKEYLGTKGSASLRGFLSFSGDGFLLAVTNERRQLFSFEFEEKQLSFLESNVAPVRDDKLVPIAIQHHPRAEFFWVLHSNGMMEAFNSSTCANTGLFNTEYIPEMDAVEQFAYWTSYEGSDWVVARDQPQDLVVHPTLNYVTFPFHRAEPRRHFMVYAALNPQHRYSFLPSLCGVTPQPDTYMDSTSACYSETFYYLSGTGQVMGCDLKDVSTRVVKDLSFMLETTGIVPYQVKYFPRREQFIVFFEKCTLQEDPHSTRQQDLTFSVFTAAINSPVKLTPGVDALIPIFATDPSVVSLGGQHNTELTVGGNKITLEKPVSHIFTSPRADGWALLFVVGNYLVYSQNADPSYRGSSPYGFDFSRKIKLKQHEHIHEVRWNCRGKEQGEKVNPSECLAAILTSHRLLIVTDQLEVLASVEAPHRYPTVYFTSIYWVGMSLLYITESQVHYMTIDGNCYLLCELNAGESVFASVWNDRIVTATRGTRDIQVVTSGVGLLQPLILGEIAAAGRCGRPARLSIDMLQYVVSTYDYKRIDLRLIEMLNHNGYNDLAQQLSSPHVACNLEVKFQQALLSRKLSTAMELLEAQCRFQKSSPPLDGLAKEMAEKLAAICISYGQYKLTYRCFELLEDYYTLMELCATYRDQEGLKKLRKKVQGNSRYNPLVAGIRRLAKSERMNSGPPPGNFDFVNSSRSFDLTPIVIPDMVGNVGENNAHILPWAFLDTVPKWFPRMLSDARHLVPSLSEIPSDATNVKFPSTEKEIVSLFITRMKGASSEISASERKLSRPSERLLPPPITRISLSRQQYYISSSSALSKNAVDVPSDPKSSAIDTSEVSGEDSEPEEEEQPATKPHSRSLSTFTRRDLPHLDSDHLVRHSNSMQSLSISAHEESSDGYEDESGGAVVPSSEEVVRAPPPRPSAPPAAPRLLPIVAVTLDQTDLGQYPCTSYARTSHTGSMERRDRMRSAAETSTRASYGGAKESMNAAQQMFDIGMFSSALCHIEKSIKQLTADASTAVQRRKEVKYCIFYKYAIRLLTTIKLLDHSEDIQQVAFYCRLLASVPLKQVHRIAAIAIAADKNLLAKNYGVAADLLRVIKAKSLYNAENVEEVLAECASERFLNSDGDISLLRPLCCFSTFREIRDSRYLVCNFCDAIFMLEVKQLDETCCYCHHGTLEWRRQPV